MAVPTRDWRTFISSLRSGDDKASALEFAGMDTAAFETVLRDGGNQVLEYEEAATAGLRARWHVSEVEGIVDDMVQGKCGGSLEKIIRARKKSYTEFLRLVERDPFLAQKYAEGRRMQAEAMADEIIMIAGDKDSKSKVDALKWLMAKMNEKFTDARKQSTAKHDATELELLLEEGRRRIEALNAERGTDGTG